MARLARIFRGAGELWQSFGRPTTGDLGQATRKDVPMFTRHLLIGCCLGVSLLHGQRARAVETAPQRTYGTDSSGLAENRSDDRYRMQRRRGSTDKGVESNAFDQDSKPAAAEKRDTLRLDPQRPAKLVRFRGPQDSPPPPPAPPLFVLASEPQTPPQMKREVPQPLDLAGPMVDRNLRTFGARTIRFQSTSKAGSPGSPATARANHAAEGQFTDWQSAPPGGSHRSFRDFPTFADRPIRRIH